MARSKRAQKQRPYRFRKREIYLHRHVERRAAGVIDFIKEPGPRVDHVQDWPDLIAVIRQTRVQRAVIHKDAVAALKWAARDRFRQRDLPFGPQMCSGPYTGW